MWDTDRKYTEEVVAGKRRPPRMTIVVSEMGVNVQSQAAPKSPSPPRNLTTSVLGQTSISAD